MIPERLKPGDMIGIASPSHIATQEGYAPILDGLRQMGFQVREADNLYASSWGYAASPEERAADLNQLIRDPEVKMIFFGGGEGADDLLPLIDYEAAKAHPKLWLSYSDGTSILNTIWSKTGLTANYGQSVGMIPGMNEYDRRNFGAHVIGLGQEFIHSPLPWRTVCPGVAEGTLIGGYLDNFQFLLHAGWVKLSPNERYVLFLEDHEKFFGVDHESVLLARLEQTGIFEQVTGLVFGHYSIPTNGRLIERLHRLGEKWRIPVIYCDDFGHGDYHAILPIGAQAHLDATSHTLTYSYQ